MKKAEVSVPDLVSSLLLASSVALVVISLILGDNLILIVGRVSKECGVIVEQSADYLASFLR
jgi:hypothetical protein